MIVILSSGSELSPDNRLSYGLDEFLVIRDLEQMRENAETLS